MTDLNTSRMMVGSQGPGQHLGRLQGIQPVGTRSARPAFHRQGNRGPVGFCTSPRTRSSSQRSSVLIPVSPPLPQHLINGEPIRTSTPSPWPGLGQSGSSSQPLPILQKFFPKEQICTEIQDRGPWTCGGGYRGARQVPPSIPLSAPGH